MLASRVKKVSELNTNRGAIIIKITIPNDHARERACDIFKLLTKARAILRISMQNIARPVLITSCTRRPYDFLCKLITGLTNRLTMPWSSP